MDFGNYSKAKLILYSILDKILDKESNTSESYKVVRSCIELISEAETKERETYEADTERAKIATETLIKNISNKNSEVMDDDRIN